MKRLLAPRRACRGMAASGSASISLDQAADAACQEGVVVAPGGLGKPAHEGRVMVKGLLRARAASEKVTPQSG